MTTLEKLADTPITTRELETLRSLKNTMNDFVSQVWYRTSHTLNRLRYAFADPRSDTATFCAVGRSQVEGIRRALMSVLDSEEDMRQLYLTTVRVCESFDL